MTTLPRVARGVGFALLLATALPAQATVVRRVPLAEVVRVSSWVVHVAVHRVTSAVDGPLRTEVELEVLETLKGVAPSSPVFVLTLPGGERDGRLARVEGLPIPTPGDELLLLLEATPQGFIPAGLYQGVYVIERQGVVPTVRRADVPRGSPLSRPWLELRAEVSTLVRPR